MDAKLVLLINCVAIVCCQRTISSRDDADWQNEYFEDISYQMESIRQLLMTQQKAAVCSDSQAIQEMKSEIKDIRQIVLKQHGNETQARQEIKSEIEDIRKIVLNDSQAIQEMKSEIIQEMREQFLEIGNFKKNCPPGFDYLPEVGSCFKVILERMTWDNATERCRQVMPGVHLAAITSQEENNAIVRYLQLQFSGVDNTTCFHISGTWPKAENMIWIGGQTKNSSRCGPYVWKPLKGIETPFNYTNWSSGSPDCYRDWENCVHVLTGFNYVWNDYPCNLYSCAICELHM